MIAERVPTLAEAARLGAGFAGIQDVLRDFLDGFEAAPSMEKLAEEPPWLAGVLKDGGLADACLAATADHLSRRHGFPRPAWAGSKARVLAKPHFAASTHGLRMILLEQSPPAFRERNIFVSANALTRA